MNRDDILKEAANGDLNALEFLLAFARRAHWVDDLADRDKLDAGEWYEPETFAEEEAHWLTALASNPFFLMHRAQLVPAMTLALSAWADSADLPPGQEAVLKGQWHEVVWLVAWLTGGWDAMRRTASSHREFDVELPIAKTCPGVLRKDSNGTLRT